MIISCVRNLELNRLPTPKLDTILSRKDDLSSTCMTSRNSSWASTSHLPTSGPCLSIVVSSKSDRQPQHRTDKQGTACRMQKSIGALVFLLHRRQETLPDPHPLPKFLASLQNSSRRIPSQALCPRHVFNIRSFFGSISCLSVRSPRLP